MKPEQRATVAKKAAAARWGQAKLQHESLKVHGDKPETPKKPAPAKKAK